MSKLSLLLPDVHAGKHEPHAIAVIDKVVRALDPDTIIQKGDALDCGALSSHEGLSPDEKTHGLLEEAAVYNKMLDRWTKNDRPFVQLAGNHEDRVNRWAKQHGKNAAFDIAKMLDVERLLRFRVNEHGEPGARRKNFKFIPYRGKGVHAHYVVAPKLIAVHGWSYAKNVAQIHLDAAKGRSITFGHCHRKQEATGRDPLTGEVFHAWASGTLSQLVPLWQAGSPNDWIHGFSIVYQGRKSWTHYNITITPNGCVLPSGKEIKV